MAVNPGCVCVCVCVTGLLLPSHWSLVPTKATHSHAVVIFYTVINTMVDTLQTRPDLGFLFPNSRHQVNLLQYADDTCIMANSPVAGQHLLDMVDRWLQWSGMRAKVPKCHCLALQGSTGKLYDLPPINRKPNHGLHWKELNQVPWHDLQGSS